MLVVCAYCGKIIGEKDPLEDKMVSHGCCEECYEKELEKLKEITDQKNPSEEDKEGYAKIIKTVNSD